MSEGPSQPVNDSVAANGVALYRWMLRHAARPTEVREEDGLLCATGAVPELCIATRTLAESSILSDEEAFGRARDFFAERQIADYLVFADLPRERTFEALLEANGFRSDYEEHPMVLAGGSPAASIDVPGLKVHEVQSEEDLATFRAVAGWVFDLYGNGDLVREVFASLDGVRVGGAHAFLGLWRGKAVATTFLLIAEGVAGVYFVATSPEARGRGIGDALVRHTAARGIAEGASAVVLAATQAGMGIYRRIGFAPTGAIAREFRSPKG